MTEQNKSWIKEILKIVSKKDEAEEPHQDLQNEKDNNNI